MWDKRYFIYFSSPIIPYRIRCQRRFCLCVWLLTVISARMHLSHGGMGYRGSGLRRRTTLKCLVKCNSRLPGRIPTVCCGKSSCWWLSPVFILPRIELTYLQPLGFAESRTLWVRSWCCYFASCAPWGKWECDALGAVVFLSKSFTANMGNECTWLDIVATCPSFDFWAALSSITFNNIKIDPLNTFLI